MPDIHISSSKKEALRKRMEALGLHEADLVEKFVLGSGAGGQKINKTASCVYLKHAPSGTELKNQSSRSREANRFFARRELCDRIEEERLGRQSKRRQEIDKIRRQKRRRSRRAKNRMLDDKNKQSKKKALRKPPKDD